jgi:hypothetical protein
VHVRVEWTGGLSSIEPVIAKLKALGVVELINTAKPAQAAPAPAQRAPRIDPIYQPDGTPCCPVHKRALTEGQFGPFCSAKATSDQVADKRGYCGLKFNS